MSIALVAVGYNRPDSMLRLLKSLRQADYGTDAVSLIVSIDKGQRQDEIRLLAEQFEWPSGDKHVRAYSQKQGLKPHILQCGDLTKEFDAVIVLEDDLTVSKGFYAYARQCIEKYGNNPKIAGISLYRHKMNPGNRMPFDVDEDPNDVYFMQVAQSWGQCWTAQMWRGFREWLVDENQPIEDDGCLPAYVCAWDGKSWLKYYDRYVEETGKFYVYPYKSLTTNNTEAGTHSIETNSDFQVPLLSRSMIYRLPELSEGLCYDAFFERMGLADKILPELDGKKLLDLQGIRTKFLDARYLISVQRLPYKVLKTFSIQYRPIEVNVLMQEEGTGIYVYDLSQPSNPPKDYDDYRLIAYYSRGLTWQKALRFARRRLRIKLKRMLRQK